MRLAKIAGIDFKLNLLFLLLGLIYVLLGLGKEILLISASVLVHEIAHIMTAFNFGIKVSEVELLPFGGQAKIDDFMGLEPEKEIYMSLAGPLISLSLAGAAFWLLTVIGQQWELFARINLFLGCFNLLPALPLDGGRVLRAAWSKKMGYRRATARAANAGKICAVAIAVIGIYLTYTRLVGANLIIIGIILYWAANREKKLLAYTFMRFLVNKKNELSKYGYMNSQQIIAQPHTLIKDILGNSRPAYYLTVLIIDDDGTIIGMRTEAELIECLLEKGPGSSIKDC